MKTILMMLLASLAVFGQQGPAPLSGPGMRGPAPGMPGPGPGMRGPGEFFAWWDFPIVKDLKVTDDQQKQIKTIVRDYRNKLIDMRAAVEKADGNLNDILNEDKIDMKRATDAVDKMATAKADLNRNLTLMSVSLRAVLTPTQWKELQRRQPQPGHLMTNRQRRMGGMQGPGMPMQGPGMQGQGMQGRGQMNGQMPNQNQGPRPNQGPNPGPQNRPGNPQPQQQPQPPKD